MPRLASQQKDFPQWYLDTVEAADLAEHAPVKGCIIFKPFGYAIWEAMQRDLDARIKSLGVENVYFPLLIPESIMAKEAEHLEGFAPECAVVTHGGGKELSEKLYVRPTSETIIYATFKKWIHSHRDLPLKINQWVNIVRWEMRTRPFLRTLEFLWQEGHTAHATKEEADQMAEEVLQMYSDFDREMLALPVLSGKKPDHDKFAGALYTLTTEALAKDGKAIQAGTSHNLGQGFSEAYDVSFLDENEKLQRPWMTSWGLSTRQIGTIIVVHGDENGLRLPPNVAPIEVVIVPIYKTHSEKKEVLKACEHIAASLPNIRTRLDDREEKTPGFKFNEWEVKGIPLRIEMGPRDLKEKKVTIVRRDTGEKKQLPKDQCNEESLQSLLKEIQEELYSQAQEWMAAHTKETSSFEELAKTLKEEGGFVWAPWDGNVESAHTVQEKTKASIRLLGDPKEAKGKKDPVSGQQAKEMALYAKAY